MGWLKMNSTKSQLLVGGKNDNDKQNQQAGSRGGSRRAMLRTYT